MFAFGNATEADQAEAVCFQGRLKHA